MPRFDRPREQRPAPTIPAWFNVLWGIFLGVIAVTMRAAVEHRTLAAILTGKQLIVTLVAVFASTLATLGAIRILTRRT